MKALEIQETERQIKALIRKSKNENQKVRLEAILIKKLNPKWSNVKVANSMEINRRTVERWFNLYEEGGLKTLCSVKRMGSRLRTTLNPTQQAALRSAITTREVRTYQDAHFWILRHFGIDMPYKNTVMFVFKQMGISLNTRIEAITLTQPDSIPLSA